MYINDFAAYSTYIRFDAVKRMISNNMDATRMLNTTSNDLEVSENEDTSSQKRHSYSI